MQRRELLYECTRISLPVKNEQSEKKEAFAGQAFNSPHITAQCVNRGSRLVLQHASDRQANNRTPAVPRSVAVSEKIFGLL